MAQNEFDWFYWTKKWIKSISTRHHNSCFFGTTKKKKYQENHHYSCHKRTMIQIIVDRRSSTQKTFDGECMRALNFIYNLLFIIMLFQPYYLWLWWLLLLCSLLFLFIRFFCWNHPSSVWYQKYIRSKHCSALYLVFRVISNFNFRFLFNKIRREGTQKTHQKCQTKYDFRSHKHLLLIITTSSTSTNWLDYKQT